MGGGYSWLTPAGMVAAASAHNPDYGKMAAESIAKELEERKLVPPSTEKIATIEEPISPATGTDAATPGGHDRP
jgi:hypothetical protein